MVGMMYQHRTSGRTLSRALAPVLRGGGAGLRRRAGKHSHSSTLTQVFCLSTEESGRPHGRAIVTVKAPQSEGFDLIKTSSDDRLPDV